MKNKTNTTAPAILTDGSPEDVIARFTLVLTESGRWGRGEITPAGDDGIMDAFHAAHATTAKGDKLKLQRGGKAWVYLVTVHRSDLCQPDTIERAGRQGIQLDGYEVGDVIPPFVGSFGPIAFGELLYLGTLTT